MNKNILTLIVCTLAFFSCTNEDNVLSSNEKDYPSDISVKNGMLVFKDQSVYETIKNKLNSADLSEKISFLDSLRFKSQLYIMHEADQELEVLCSTQDKKIFDSKYQEFKDKYENIFMFNNVDSTDLSPYCRLEQLDLNIFANADGEFIIGDSLIKCKDFNAFSDYYSKTSYFTESGNALRAGEVNRIHVQDGDRKVGMYLSRYVDQINANFTAQKSTLFGWVRYDTKYSFRINVFSGEYWHIDYIASNGHETLALLHPGRSVTCETRELSGNITIKIGYTGYSGLRGTYEIWSRGVSYEKRGIGTMSL